MSRLGLGLESKRFNQHFRFSPARIVTHSAGGGQGFRSAEAKAAFLQKVVDGLRRQAEEFLDADLPSVIFDEGHEAEADALVFELGRNADARHFGFALIGMLMKGDAASQRAIDVEDE